MCGLLPFRLLSALPLVGVIALVLAPAALSEEPPPLPAARSLSLIAWHPKGWVIDIEKDGSGSLRYGIGEVEPATFPAGTVSFQQVLEWAETRRQVAPNHAESVITVIDRSAEGKSEEPMQKARAMIGDLQTISQQILPHLHARDVAVTLELLRAHPLLQDPGDFNLTKVVEAAAPPAPGKVAQPAKDTAVLIRMTREGTGWELTVEPDGSGSIVFGSRGGDCASFPKGTVSFQDLIAAARSSRLVGLWDPQAVQVQVRISSEARESLGVRAMSREWEAMGKQILAHLEVMESWEKHFGELLEERPLIEDTTVKPQFQKRTERWPEPKARPATPVEPPKD
ncbi:hypothetical protein [Haloferula sp. BvORR071]|uniref:hypothetical protein n=1 Tax=Haloferula sp. BvORR071 TaxID=1396141 RepID=UPI0005542E9D|nr:hypothetical protein [Haloferula sp. BvORR071]